MNENFQQFVDDREPYLEVAVGRKGVGKTHTTKKVINAYVRGNPNENIKGRKVLIIDVNNEFTEYRRIDPKDVLLFSVHPKIECRRVVPFAKDGKPLSLSEISKLLQHCLDNFKGGMILIEDISKYVGDSVSTDIIGHLCTVRHKDTDVYVHFQGIGKSGHPKILMNTNCLRLHWVEDSVERHKNKFADKEQILKIGEALVQNSVKYGLLQIREIKKDNPNWKQNSSLKSKINEIKNKYLRFFVYINYDEQVITGQFDEQQMRDAIFTYISQNQKSTLWPAMESIDRNGNSIFKSKKEALIKLEDDLFHKFYGNKL